MAASHNSRWHNTRFQATCKQLVIALVSANFLEEVFHLDSRAETAKSGIFLGTDQHIVRSVITERRVKPRIRQPFPTRVSGVDSEDHPFDLSVGLENISSCGIYLRIPRLLKFGDELSLVVRFSNGHQGATAALRASVVRVDPGPDDLYGIAMAIQQYEFI